MAWGYGSTHPTDATGSGVNLTVYIIRRFVSIVRNKLKLARYATMADIPMRSGSTVARWILPVDIGINTTAIAEFGTATQVATFSWTPYETTAVTYGLYGKISDLADASWLPQAKNKVSDLFAYSGQKTIDTLHRADIQATTTFIVSGQTDSGTGTLTTSDTMTAQDVAVVGGYFDRNDCEGFDDVGGDFVLVVHGEPAQDLQTHVEPGGITSNAKLSWAGIMMHTVPGQRKLQNYEIGTYAGVSVQKSNNIATSTETNTVTAYNNLGLSRDAFGRTNLDMRNVRLIEIPANRADKSDPLGLYGTIGWKARMGHRGLDLNTRAVRLLTAK